MRTKISLACLAAVTVLPLSLVGCSVDVVDDSGSSGSNVSPADSSSVTADDAETETADDADTETFDDETDVDSDVDLGLSRDELSAMVTRTERCDGELTLLDNGMSTRVDGDCDVLTLNTTGSQIVADDVTTLQLIGDGNVVIAGAVETLLVNGEGNIVVWTGDTPAVTDVGSTNVLKAE